MSWLNSRKGKQSIIEIEKLEEVQLEENIEVNNKE